MAEKNALIDTNHAQSDDKMFVCEICPKKCKHKSSLIIHQKYHSEE